MIDNRSKFERLKQLPRATQEQFLNSLTAKEALDLQHDITFIGRPKQQLPLTTDWDVLLALAGRGFGKMLTLDTPIATTTGWTTMNDIVVGEEIFDELGNVTTVIGVHDKEYNKKTYRVHFNDGSYIDAGGEHLWSVKTARITVSITISTKDIIDLLIIDTHVFIDVATPLRTKSKSKHVIIDIVEIDSAPMRCISVDSPNYLYLAGRSMIPTHNSFMGSHAVLTWARLFPGCRIALIGETTADVRDVMIKGDSGILKQAHPKFTPIYNPSTRLMTFPNGSIAQTFSGIEPGQLRGPQFHFAWVDELAKYRYQEELWDMLTMCLRLGTHPQTIITTTPRPTKLIKQLAKDSTTIVVTGSSFENTELPQHTLDSWKKKYEGTRLGRQELYAEILVDNPNALFTIGNIIKNRISSQDLLIADRTVVAVDPAVTNNINSDDTGIVVAKRLEEHGYLIHDSTMKGTPNDWANEAVRVYHLYEADCIVYENNQGGMMTEQLIHNIDPNIKVIGVRAFKNKQSRAEPVSALYEQDRIHHVGTFLELETEIVDFDPTLQQRSPNRLDALVYAFTELFGLNIVTPKVWSFND